MPLLLTYLARAHSALGQSAEARRCIGEAMTAVETAKERWCESEVNRVAGEISLRSRYPNRAKAVEYFERALTVAHTQQAKSLELRAAMSMVCEEIGDATADQSGVLAQAWALPAGSWPEGRVSIRSSIGGDGIMMYQS